MAILMMPESGQRSVFSGQPEAIGAGETMKFVRFGRHWLNCGDQAASVLAES
jgi:hypothetical protein